MDVFLELEFNDVSSRFWSGDLNELEVPLEEDTEPVLWLVPEEVLIGGSWCLSICGREQISSSAELQSISGTLCSKDDSKICIVFCIAFFLGSKIILLPCDFFK